MEYSNRIPSAEIFLCSEKADFHDYYCDAFDAQPEDSLFYCIKRTGIVARIPKVFYVERNNRMAYCEIFCIFSGKGTLTFRDKVYPLRRGQIIVLPAYERHTYSSDAAEPLGKSWVEFYGGDSQRIVNHIVDTQGPVIEGAVFYDVISELSILQRRLMAGETKRMSLNIYQMLLVLLEYQERYGTMKLDANIRENFIRAEAYIEAHLQDTLRNEHLANICGLSLSYFMKQFKQIYRMTPQQYIMERRFRRGRELLIQTQKPVNEIAEELSFCNASHFIRQFRSREGISPAQFRKKYGICSGY